MSELQITCLGDFQVTIAGTTRPTFQTDKSRALLAYLAIERQLHQRTTLAQFLWSGYDDVSARNSLRQTLHQLRQTLRDGETEPPWLLLTRQTVQINPAATVSVDVVTFQRLLTACETHTHAELAACAPCLARLQQAVNLYHGDFLGGLSVIDTGEFEEWRRVTQEQLHIQMLNALTHLATVAERKGDDEGALHAAQRQLALEPWLEGAHRQIMRVLAQRGQRAAAEAQYQRCRQVLAAEMNSEPDAETTALYARIRSGAFDQVLRRQGERVTRDPSTAAPQPPITVSLRAAEPGSPLDAKSDLVIATPLYNLPTPLPPLIGRERELAEIVSRLEQPGARLLTLVGPGGMGKTRLALAAAAQVAPHFAAGVCLVELAELTEPVLLPQTVAAALGQTEPAASGGEDAVAHFLGNKALLLVLDNCEHMAEAVAHWSKRWLNACPQLRILATSHGALTVPGEALWSIPTLACPPPAEVAPDQLLTFAAVQLFVTRAGEVKAGFTLTAANGAAIAEICRQLDGIPLALELAAARVRSLTPAEIAARLKQGIGTALANNRSAPARQQTMQAALDWSFAALEGDEQLLFQQLALFAGGFTLPALESVTQWPDALDLLERLIERALVITETLGEQSRYRLLGVVRKYAADKLSVSDLASTLRQRHATYFLQLAESAQMDSQADGEALWLQPEAENLSSAMEWALTNAEANLAVRLAGALTWYWWMRGYLRTQRSALQRALAHLASATQPPASAAPHADPLAPALRALATGALFALWEEPDQARLAFTQALTLAEAVPHPHLSGLALRRLAAIAIQQKAYEAANTFIERGLAVWQALGGVWHIAWLYAHQGDLADERGDQAQAWSAYAASSRLPVSPGARAYPLRRMAYLALARGDRSGALALCRESLQLNRASGDRQGIAACLVGVARFTVASAQTLPQAAALPLLRRAAELLGAAATLLQTVEGRLLQVDEVAYQQTLHLLQEELAVVAPAMYQAALAAGRAATVEQATALALQEDAITPLVEPLPLPEPANLSSDRVTREQGDTVTSRSSVTASPSHLVTNLVTRSPLLDWAEMPIVDSFVERRAEMAQLTAWLPPAAAGGVSAQLISLLGIGGMGKTTLAAAVTKAVAPNFAVVIWRSLLNAPPLSELLRSWLQTLSRQTLTAFPASRDEQLRLLLTYLQQERCLLILDNVESIFAADPVAPAAPAGTAQPPSRAGVTRPGYEGYDQLFQWLASSDHQSCLLLTSREQPYALLRSGRQAQVSGRIQTLLLTGLDQPAAQALLQNNGLHASAAEVTQLVENYSGNPLALQIVAATIADFFGGDVAAFQQEEGQLFDGMRLVLDQQFARLSPLEREILIWLAIERTAITAPILRSNFVHPVATAPLLEALQALQNRSLLEKSEGGFTLQNVITEYTTDYLVEQVYHEITEFRFTRPKGSHDWSETVPGPGSVTRNSQLVTSFLNRFALLKAQAREEVRQSQVRLILQPLANRLLAHLGKPALEARVMTLVQELQAAEPVVAGYAGGNLLNLLLHIGSDLRGRDFARLALWQVFLAGADAPGLKLAGANLRGSVFTQRFSPLSTFGFDAQGELLLAEISEGRLRLLRLHDGWLYREVALPALRILRLSLSPGCDVVLLHLADYQLALLDLTSGQLFSSLARHQHTIWRIGFSPDGRLVASGDSSGLVCIWDRHSGQLRQARQITNDAVSALALAPDGVTIASASVTGTVFLWSLTDPAALCRLEGHNEEVATLTFLDNGTLLASGSHDLTVGLWDVATGELRQRLRGHTRPLRLSAASVMGPWLVTGGGDHFLYVWDWQRGAPQHLLTAHGAAIEHLVISGDGQRAATIDLNAVVSLWDLAQGRRLDFYPIYHNQIMSIQYTPDGETLVSGGSDGTVYLWQLKDDNVRMTAHLSAHKQRIFAVAVHPDGDLIASAGDSAAITLWARHRGELLHTLQSPTRNISMLAITPDGQWLASSHGDGTVNLWSLPDGRERRELQAHTNVVGCCVFSPSRRDALGRPQQRLASGSLDQTLAIWDVERGTLLHRLHGHTNAIGRCLFSHDGQRLISSSYDETLRIWDVASGAAVAVWPQSGGGYIALAIHPAGEILAVSCIDQSLRLLDLQSGQCLAVLAGHSQLVFSLAFHPTGQWLASAGADETIKLWDLTGDALKTGLIVCRHTLQAPAPYAGMNITGVTGISEAQKAALRALGAVEE